MLWQLFCLALTTLAVPNLNAEEAAKPAEVLLASANSIQGTSVLDLLAGKAPFLAEPNDQFVKIDLAFAEPIKLSRVEVDACENKFSDGADFYFDFNRSFRYAEGGKKTLAVTLAQSTASQSLTINFRRNTKLCVSAIRFFSQSSPLKLLVPYAADGVAEISSASDENLSSLFDMRLESIWRSALKTGHAFKVHFNEPKEVKKLRFWNGDQRSSYHLKKSASLKFVTLQSGDKATGHTFKFELASRLGPQEVSLPAGFSTHDLDFVIEEVSSSLDSAPLTISEIQFFDGTNWFTLANTSAEKQMAKKNLDLAAQAKVEEILGANLVSVEDDDQWIFRIKADGSFFLRGYSNVERGARAYYILGQHTMSYIKPNWIRLHLSGLMRSSSLEMDSSSIGRDISNEQDRTEESEIVEQTIRLRRGPDNYYRIDNLEAKKSQKLHFGPVRMRLSRSHDS